MAYITFSKDERYGPRKGLDGPYHFGNGRVLYYDPTEGKYWDPKTDFYLENDEVGDLQGLLFAKLRA